jgi:parvulin-like peptidyl-prolyl isomerase
LLHFLLLGLALFVFYGRVAPRDDGGDRIVVSQAQVDLLASQFQATWYRPPTPEELSGLVDTWIRDEILYREGRALGLDQSDPVIKRRVRQKLDVMFEESLARDAPTEADLEQYLQANPDRFRRPARLTFEQVFLGEAASPTDAEPRAAKAREALQRGVDAAEAGEPTMLPAREDDAPLDLVARDFGNDFADQLPKLPVGEWVGPVMSGFGAHLVRVNSVQAAELPPLEAVRAAVSREWENERRKRGFDDAYRKLRERYDVVIEADLPGKAALP